MTRFRITIGDRSYDVEVGSPQQSPMTVIVDGETFSVHLQPLEDESDLQAISDQSPSSIQAGASRGGQSQVTAPMPGTIMDIAVRPGDRVQQGQTLCNLEAMKMKSPIRVLRAGTVRQVQVSEGQTVDHGDLLFVVE